MENEFDILVAKVLAGEASDAEQARLNILLAADPELKSEFIELQKVGQTLRDLGPLAAALDAAPSPVPAERRRELEHAVQAKFGRTATYSKESTPATAQHNSLASLRSWLEIRFGRWSFSAAVSTLAMIVVLCVLWSMIPARRAQEQTRASRIGYLLMQQGRAELQHAGQMQSVETVSALEKGDALELAAATRAFAITPEETVSLTGPRKIGAGELAALLAEKRSPEPASKADPLRVALLEPATNLADANLLLATRASQPIPIYSPLGATASLTPLLLWKSEPGKTYDVLITDELNAKTPPWQISGVVPPVQFTQVTDWQGRALAKDGLYRVRLTATGEPLTVSTYTFRTLKEVEVQRPASIVERLLHSHQLLASDSGCLGDALVELLMLPDSLANSELALRLKLLAFGQAGYRNDFESVALKLKSVSEK